MAGGLSESEMKDFIEIAQRAARKVSRDGDVVDQAANFAVMKLADGLDHVSTGTPERKAWVATVARNEARRVGKKLHRDLAMGRAGSLPPPMHDEQADDRVELLIREMRSGGGQSLGSFVASKVDFERAWALISGPDRLLLDLKYAQGLSSKEIARQHNKKPGTVDNQLTAAKQAARLLFEDLLGDFDTASDDERWQE